MGVCHSPGVEVRRGVPPFKYLVVTIQGCLLNLQTRHRE